MIRSLFLVLLLTLPIAVSHNPRAEDAAPAGKSAARQDDLLGELGGQIKDSGPGGPLGCLEYAPNLSEDEVLRQLEALGVKMDAQAPIRDRALLFYLLAYFTTLQPRLDPPIILKQGTEDGPVLVTAGGRKNELLFHKGAGDRVFTARYQQAAAAAQAAPGREAPAGRAAPLRVEFSNTLFEQLTTVVGDSQPDGGLKFVQRILLDQYGVQTEAPDPQNTQAFTFAELRLILKQLTDLPKSVVRKAAPHLTRLIRHKTGQRQVSGGYEIAAEYGAHQRAIDLFDAAFAFNPTLKNTDKGTFLHEYAHAVWEGLSPADKKDFIDLSWTSNKDGNYVAKKDASLFLQTTSYAQVHPEEDFAEHFAAFVELNPLFSRTVDARKYGFFKDRVFGGRHYTDETHARARAQVTASCPADVTPPTVEGFDILVSLHGDAATARCALRGLRDDLTGLDRGRIVLRRKGAPADSVDPRNFCYLTIDGAKCVAQDGGLTIQDFEIDLSRVYPGEYAADELVLTDKAGNSSYLNAEDKSVTLPGRAVVLQPLTQPAFFEGKKEEIARVRIAPVDQAAAGNNTAPGATMPTAELTLPIKHEESLERVRLVWRSRRTLRAIQHTIEARQLTSKPGDAAVSALLGMAGGEGDDTLELVSVQASYGETAKNAPSAYQVNVDGGAISFDVQGPPRREPAKIVVNEMKVEPVYGPAGANGRPTTRAIRVRVPVRGGTGQFRQFTVSYKDPTGRVTNYGGSETRDGDVYQIEIPLGPNHPEGTYSIDQIHVYENTQPGTAPGPGAVAPSADLRHVHAETTTRGVSDTYNQVNVGN